MCGETCFHGVEWGITFEEPYQTPERAARKVIYAGKRELVQAILHAQLSEGWLQHAEAGGGACVSFFNAEYGDQELEARAKMVCLYLHDRANKDGESWYAIDSIARDLHLSRSTVKRAIQDLLRLG